MTKNARGSRQRRSRPCTLTCSFASARRGFVECLRPIGCGGRACFLSTSLMLFCQYRRAPVMPILAMPERAAEFRCRSAANPVPAPQNALDFRCRPARSNRVQRIDCKQILDPDRTIFGGENAIFRCRQGNCDGFVIVGARRMKRADPGCPEPTLARSRNLPGGRQDQQATPSPRRRPSPPRSLRFPSSYRPRGPAPVLRGGQGAEGLMDAQSSRLRRSARRSTSPRLPRKLLPTR